jgi:monoamine oxidase
MKYDVIIIGAGAAGLVAMKELLNAGRRVCMLEASARAGGRIQTLEIPGFSHPVEQGAEFVHGRLPVTLNLLQQASLNTIPVGGSMITVGPHGWLEGDQVGNEWDSFLRKAKGLSVDMSLLHFLDEFFPAGHCEVLRSAVLRFAEGFDLADPSRVSVMSIAQEWAEEHQEQYRVAGGYSRLIECLFEDCRHLNGEFYFNTPVTRIEHSDAGVSIYAGTGSTFTADIAVSTVSLGVLAKGNIEFVPAVPRWRAAISEMGFGTVIKLLFSFRSAFWKDYSSNIGFLLSRETIPTWWTQHPGDSNVLTGWLGGPSALDWEQRSQQEILDAGLRSVSRIFQLPVSLLNKELITHQIICWGRNEFVRGGYSYVTPASQSARTALAQPESGVLFFAGEAFSSSQAIGTVEAALDSGLQTAKYVIDHAR